MIIYCTLLVVMLPLPETGIVMIIQEVFRFFSCSIPLTIRENTDERLGVHPIN